MAYNTNEERLLVKGSEQITRDLKVNRDAYIGETLDTKNLIIEDDLNVKGESIFDDDVAIHGDLYVEGTTTTTSEAQVSSSGNYVVTRDNNATPLATGEYSGLAVNNYATGKIATITADKEGTWRISDSATASATTYTNISAYNGVYYTGLTQTTTTGPSGILTNVDADELASVVKNGSSYYHKAGNDWFGPVTLVSNALDVGSIVTSSTLINTLNGLTKHDLVYYRSATDKSIDASTNQPLLTRNEEANLTNDNLLSWDGTNKRAVDSGISKTMDTTPTANSTKLVTSGGVKTYVDNAIDALDVASVGGDTKYISAISETNGKISATVKDVAQTYSSTGTTAASGKAIAAAIGTLDVASVGGSGKYISAISETDGKISATSTTMDTAPTADSVKAVTSGGVKTAIDAEATARNTAITNAINALDVSSVGGAGKYISAISETDGKISATSTTMDTTPTANSTNAVTSGGIKTAINTAETNAKNLANATGTLAIAHGGTGQTTAENVVNELIQAGLGDASADVADTTSIITTNQAGYSTTNKGLYRRPATALWNYIKGKISSVLGLTVTAYGGKATTAGTADVAYNTYSLDKAVTCSTAAATAAKTVTLSGFVLVKGAKLIVNLSNANTAASALTLNVNSTGAKTIRWNGNVTSASTYAMPAGYYNCYYDGTYWDMDSACEAFSARTASGCSGNSSTADTTRGTAYCTTAAGTAAKVASMRGYVLQNGATFPITFTTANTAASALTLAVNGTTAKPIYINNAASSSSNYTLPAGTYLCRYNGTNYYIDTGFAVTQARNCDFANQADYTRSTAYCTTAAGTAAKAASMRGYALSAGSFLITFTTTNTAASALTLNINSKGAKPIWINGEVSSASNYTLPAGTYLCTYDGTEYLIGTSGANVDSKMDKNNPTGTGSFSLNRRPNTTIGTNSFAEGYLTEASGIYSHAEGYGTVASGQEAHAEGSNTTASGTYSHAEVGGTTASGDYSHAEGLSTTASGEGSHAEGGNTEASGNYSHAEGWLTKATKNYAHVEGSDCTASEDYSHAEGRSTTASGNSSHAEGRSTRATGIYSHTEGYVTVASSDCAHAEGVTTEATGAYSHAEGASTTASGSRAHAEGDNTTASGSSSHAEGLSTAASGAYSHTEGLGTKASSNSQHAQGKYNIEDANNTYADIVGNGTNNSDRKNISALDWNGNLHLKGNVYTGCNDDSTGGAVLLPVGTIMAFYLTTAPTGWLELNGQAFDQSVYPKLLVELGSNILPDLRNRTLMGYNNDSTKGKTSAVGDVQDAQLPYIAGSVDMQGANENGSANGPFAVTGRGYHGAGSSTGRNYINGVLFNSARSGASNDHLGHNVYAENGETRPANLRVMWCIKAC